MTAAAAKAIWVALAVGWYLIRIPHQRRSRKTPVKRSERGAAEWILLSISFTGLGILPFLYVATGFPKTANHTFHTLQGWLGAVVAVGALWLFHLTHRTLGRNWSVSLEVRATHTLVTDGVYSRVRHPMYTAFWLWALAQALLLPNWVAGLSGLVGFGTLYGLRVGREEKLMLDSFGDAYVDYMRRTGRLVPGLSGRSISDRNRPAAPDRRSTSVSASGSSGS
jgi:protein-S-isoprenylcysteine O-methyltransferase Ste14